jgi:hypothetical protein
MPVVLQYRFLSIYAGVTPSEHPKNAKTTQKLLFWPSVVFLAFNSTQFTDTGIRGENLQITSFVLNSKSVDIQRITRAAAACIANKPLCNLLFKHIMQSSMLIFKYYLSQMQCSEI